MRPTPRLLLAFLKSLRWLGLGLSTILFVATVALWVRNTGHEERWDYQRFAVAPEGSPIYGTVHQKAIIAMYGRVELQLNTWAVLHRPGPNDLYYPPLAYGHDRGPLPPTMPNDPFDKVYRSDQRPWPQRSRWAWSAAGAGFYCDVSGVVQATGQPEERHIATTAPFWMLAVAFGLWPGVAVGRRLLRRKRHAPGHCPACGYDLRATPDRCPECGRAVAPGRG